jgi:Iap family predicted aminopeptidase
MTNKDYILKITDTSKPLRIEKIIACINKNYVIQTAQPTGEFPTARDLTNIIIPAKIQKDKIAIFAHHDVYPGSLGFNDNSSGVITALRLQDHLKDNIELVFTDGEERGGQGCRYYLENFPRPKRAINLDVVGLRGKIFYEEYGKTDFVLPTSLEKYDDIPFSDSRVLEDYGIPNILLLTGKNKETLIRDIFFAEHCGRNDNKIEVISEDIMNLVVATVAKIIGV